MLNRLLADLSSAFDPIAEVAFHFERLERNPRFAAIARPGNGAVVCKLRVDMDDRGGCTRSSALGFLVDLHFAPRVLPDVVAECERTVVVPLAG